MKKQTTIVVNIPKVKKTRVHIVLFTNDSPFKPKVVKSKKEFKRQEKHRNSKFD
jgi:hypothetical protein